MSRTKTHTSRTCLSSRQDWLRAEIDQTTEGKGYRDWGWIFPQCRYSLTPLRKIIFPVGNMHDSTPIRLFLLTAQGRKSYKHTIYWQTTCFRIRSPRLTLRGSDSVSEHEFLASVLRSLRTIRGTHCASQMCLGA